MVLLILEFHPLKEITKYQLVRPLVRPSVPGLDGEARGNAAFVREAASFTGVRGSLVDAYECGACSGLWKFARPLGCSLAFGLATEAEERAFAWVSSIDRPIRSCE